MADPDFLFELLIIALDAPAQLRQVYQTGESKVLSKRESQYLVDSSSPADHSTNSHSSGLIIERLSSRWAARTRTRANRDDSISALPSRHLIVRQARLGNFRASSLTAIGWCLRSRRSRFVGRPWPDHFFGGSGRVSHVHTVVGEKIPAT